jgi:hypothetical protein
MDGNVAHQPAVDGKGLKPYAAPTLTKGPVLNDISAQQGSGQQ